MKKSFLLLFLLQLGSADDSQLDRLDRCVSNSTDTKDLVYIQSHFYNKLEFLRFDSRVGLFVGYTEFGVKNAERWNNNTNILEMWRHEKYRYCVPTMKTDIRAIMSKSVEPYAVMTTAPSGGSERVLVCSVYGFYPKDISVTWTNHQQPLDSGVSTTDLLPDSDWTYQLHSHLEYSPRSGDQISCVIEHKSLKEPMVLDYEGALSDGDRNKIAIGASGLVLGLVLSLAGFIYYRHKSRGLILVPNH